jgi:hypothetical protein
MFGKKIPNMFLGEFSAKIFFKVKPRFTREKLRNGRGGNGF